MHIKSTFLHLNKIGYKTERELWAKKIFNWNDYQKAYENDNLFFDETSSVFYDSLQAFTTKDVDFFASRLPKNEYYRLALTFPEDVMFLDIETTGLSQYYDHITMIGWSIGQQYDFYIHGINKENKFIDALSKAKIIVTFNGSIFDVPFIKKNFSQIKVPECHIDLRFLSKKVGLSGGQKVIEEQIGFKRIKSLQNTDGFVATVLWDEYKWGKKAALEKLIAYNHSDVEGMKAILDYCIKQIYRSEKYKKHFEIPVTFKSFKSKLDKKAIKEFVQNSVIPFDPKATLKYQELSKRIGKSFKIVGIDLTGSEERASGVCMLENNRVRTMRINSDEDMINLVTDFQPDLVSIDSPLSLPYGRISVFDDDPGRDEYGILRVCERVLKKRGVNAYPTLLPSMQKLTKRGIELATTYRKLGIPVIESYPGVVQDIIGLPRKQASLTLLKKGLGIFGLEGAFLKKNVSHDEIDAITSAIVGIFFLSKDYEAIGDMSENLMIIPDLNASKNGKKVIGFSGKIASGKTTASKFFEEHGFTYVRYSQILESILRENGHEVTRENLQRLGLEMSEKQIELSKKVYEEVKDKNHIVIDGLRHPEDYTFFFEMFGFDFYHIYISSNEVENTKRFENLYGDTVKYAKVVQNDAEKNVSKLKNLSYKIIDNDGTIDDFKEKLSSFFREIQ